MIVKVCPICKVEKSVDEFHKYWSKSRNKYRYSNYCKPCARENAKPRAQKHFQDNKQAKLQYAKDYRANPENKDKLYKLSSKFKKQYRTELQACYVAEQAAKALKTTVADIRSTPEILAAYTLNLKIKRKINNYGAK